MRTACLMMQKDETLLLKPWLLHHGDLFGYPNLYVFDNGSTDPDIIATLTTFQRFGVNVNWEFNTQGHFNGKGKYVGDKVLELRAAGTHDMALLLDCDEFAAVTTEAGLGLRRPAVTAELSRLFNAGKIARTGEALFNVRGRFNEFHATWHTKCITPVATFTGIDHGFHQANIPQGETYAATSFTYLHFHNKPFAHLLASAKAKLCALGVDINNLEEVRNYRGTGHHLVPYLFMTPQEYYAGAAPATLVCDDLTNWLATQIDMRPIVHAWESK